jgi:hypothetical protein
MDNKTLEVDRPTEKSQQVTKKELLQTYEFSNVIPDIETIKNRSKNPNRCPLEFFTIKDRETGEIQMSLSVEGMQSEDDVIEALRKVTGIDDPGLANKLCALASGAMPGKQSEALCLVLQALNASRPKNAIEAGLIAQIAVLEAQAFTYLKRAEASDMLDRNVAAINIATKLIRLKNECITTLDRLRRGNEQRLTVQHQYVQVNEGGKAMVAQFEGGGEKIKGEVPHGV